MEGHTELASEKVPYDLLVVSSTFGRYKRQMKGFVNRHSPILTIHDTDLPF